MRLQSPRFSIFARSTLVTSVVALSLPLLQRPALGQQIQLVHANKLSSTADSLPRIAHPSPAQTRINRVLAKIDMTAHGRVRNCRGRSDQGYPMSYERTINVTVKGPKFLSFDSDEQFDCGGVHPYSFSYSLTFDLQTGEQVNWSKYFTAATAEGVISTSQDGNPIEAVSSPRLAELYTKGYGENENCEVDLVLHAVSNGDEQPLFLMSPSRNKQGLNVTAFDSVPNQNACLSTVTLGKREMDILGIPPAIQAEVLVQP